MSLIAGLAPLIEPGFFSNSPVRVAIVVGGVVAVVSAVVGTFTVLRGQSFAGHSLADIGSAGGAAAFLFGVSPLYGFLAMNVVAAGAMELVGVRNARARDVTTGVMLGGALGLAALFLYLDATSTSTTGTAINVLFGSIFTFQSSLVPFVIGLGASAVGAVFLMYRPLVLSSLSNELAAAQGTSPQLIGVCYLLALSFAVSLSAITIGAILSTALLVGPAAAAARLTSRVWTTMLLAVGFGLSSVWIGILLAYDSFYWRPSHSTWPVSFFVVALVVFLNLIAQTPLVHSNRRRKRLSSAAAIRNTDDLDLEQAG